MEFMFIDYAVLHYIINTCMYTIPYLHEVPYFLHSAAWSGLRDSRARPFYLSNMCIINGDTRVQDVTRNTMKHNDIISVWEIDVHRQLSPNIVMQGAFLVVISGTCLSPKRYSILYTPTPWHDINANSSIHIFCQLPLLIHSEIASFLNA